MFDRREEIAGLTNASNVAREASIVAMKATFSGW
jgi:hypothetical protein